MAILKTTPLKTTPFENSNLYVETNGDVSLFDHVSRQCTMSSRHVEMRILTPLNAMNAHTMLLCSVFGLS